MTQESFHQQSLVVVLGNGSDEFRGAFWGLDTGAQVSSYYLQEVTEASHDIYWIEYYKENGYDLIPVDYEGYGHSSRSMVSGAWYDFGFWRPVIFVGGFFVPQGKVISFVSELWGAVEEFTDDIMEWGHPLGEYLTIYPTIKFANQWGYLPTTNTYSFLAPQNR